MAAQESYPQDLRYSKEHEWTRVEGDSVVVGITWFAQDQLGDVVFVELPGVGQELKAGDVFGVVESVKTASDLYSPVSGRVMAINDELADAPELVNEDPYGKGWMIRLALSDVAELDALLDAAGYQRHVKEAD